MMSPIFKDVNTNYLKSELNNLKKEVSLLKREITTLQTKDLELETKISIFTQIKEEENNASTLETSVSDPLDNLEKIILEPHDSIQNIERIFFQKWYSIIIIVVDDLKINVPCLMDSGTDQNCIKDWLIPSKYYEKTKDILLAANAMPLIFSSYIRVIEKTNETLLGVLKFTFILGSLNLLNSPENELLDNISWIEIRGLFILHELNLNRTFSWEFSIISHTSLLTIFLGICGLLIINSV